MSVDDKEFEKQFEPRLDEIASMLKSIEAKTIPLLEFVRMVAAQPCQVRTKQSCDELPGYEEHLWCIPCLARQTLRKLPRDTECKNCGGYGRSGENCPDCSLASIVATCPTCESNSAQVAYIKKLEITLKELETEFKWRSRVRPGETDGSMGEKIAYEEAARLVTEERSKSG